MRTVVVVMGVLSGKRYTTCKAFRCELLLPSLAMYCLCSGAEAFVRLDTPEESRFTGVELFMAHSVDRKARGRQKRMSRVNGCKNERMAFTVARVSDGDRQAARGCVVGG